MPNAENDAGWAPNYDVPENASPFKPLPMLTRCVDCREPLEPMAAMTQVRDGHAVAPLCQTCVIPPGSDGAP